MNTRMLMTWVGSFIGIAPTIIGFTFFVQQQQKEAAELRQMETQSVVVNLTDAGGQGTTVELFPGF